jgi:hypothetical protein
LPQVHSGNHLLPRLYKGPWILCIPNLAFMPAAVVRTTSSRSWGLHGGSIAIHKEGDCLRYNAALFDTHGVPAAHWPDAHPVAAQLPVKADLSHPKLIGLGYNHCTWRAAAGGAPVWGKEIRTGLASVSKTPELASASR